MSVPETTDAWERLAPHLDSALEALDDEKRSVLVLRYFQGMSDEEVAVRLGCGIDQAVGRISQAQEELQTELSRHGVQFEHGEITSLLQRNVVQVPPSDLLITTTDRMSLVRRAAAAAGLRGAKVAIPSDTGTSRRRTLTLRLTAGIVFVAACLTLAITWAAGWNWTQLFGASRDTVPADKTQHATIAVTAAPPSAAPHPPEPGFPLTLGVGVPDLSAPIVGGATVSLAALRGKYVLIDFWAGYNNQRMELAVKLRDVFDRFRDDPRLAMIGFDLDDRAETVQSWAAREAIGWPQGIIDSSRADVPTAYQEPADPILIIAPDGKLIARSQEIFAPYRTLERVLGAKLGPASLPPIQVLLDHNDPSSANPQYRFKTLPPPEKGDAAEGADIEGIDADLDLEGKNLNLLTDGRGADNDDDSRHAIYARRWRLQDRLRMDLHRIVPIAQINTYSWHKGERCPQVYRVYGSDGSNATNLRPQNGLDPRSCGWALITSVDTRPTSGPMGGQDAVSIRSATGCVGHYRYLLFQVFPTSLKDGFGNTFYNEIDVIEQK